MQVSHAPWIGRREVAFSLCYQIGDGPSDVLETTATCDTVCAGLRSQPGREADAGPYLRPPDDPREHLAIWLGVSEVRVSQIMRSLVDTWGLVERLGQRGDTRYTLSAEGIRYVTHRDRAQLPTTQGIWGTALTTDKQSRRRHVGHRIETWAQQTKHADGITWFLSKLQAEARADPHSELEWSVPTARSDRA